MEKWVVLIVCVIVSLANAGTVGYWELDATDGVGSDAFGNYDLNAAGSVVGFSTQADPVPNPDLTPGFFGDPAANPGNAHLDYANVGNGLYSSATISAMQFAKDRPFTVEGWSRTSSGSYQYIVGNYGQTGGYEGFYVLTTGMGLKFGIRQNGAAVEATSASNIFSTYSNNHFAAVWDPATGANGQMRLYLNGNLVASADGSVDWNNTLKGGVFSVGGRNFDVGSPSWLYNGQLDEIRYSNSALSPEYFLNGTIPVPEPTSLLLLCLGGISVLKRR